MSEARDYGDALVKAMGLESLKELPISLDIDRDGDYTRIRILLSNHPARFEFNVRPTSVNNILTVHIPSGPDFREKKIRVIRGRKGGFPTLGVARVLRDRLNAVIRLLFRGVESNQALQLKRNLLLNVFTVDQRKDWVVNNMGNAFSATRGSFQFEMTARLNGRKPPHFLLSLHNPELSEERAKSLVEKILALAKEDEEAVS